VPAPRILIVDDQRDISRMLRAAVETLGQGYVIVDVPSAEEAQLEFRRGPVDLLITDLRLPGISGLELIRKLHKASSEAAMIVISGYADETARAEFRSLGATFFAKPLDLPAFLKGVQTALAGREPAAPEPARDDAPSLANRLERLRRDLGALAVFLVDRDGRLLLGAGEAPNLDLGALLPGLVEAFQASLKVSQALGGKAARQQPAGRAVPGNVQFFDGTAYGLYSANVGAEHALIIAFDGQRAAGQMGHALRYGRQAADDLLNILRTQGAPVAAAEGGPSAAEAPAAQPVPAHKKKTGPLRKKTAPLPKLEDAAPDASPAAPSGAPAEKTPPAAEPASPEAAPARDTAAEKTTSQAAADFWAAVDGAGLGDDRAGTISWEEAAKLGLVKGEKPDKK